MIKPIDFLIKKLSWPTPYPSMWLSYKTWQRRDEHNKRVYVTFLYSRAIAIKWEYEAESIFATHMITTYIPKIDELTTDFSELVQDHTNEAKQAWYDLDYTRPMLEKYIWLPKPF